MTELIAYRYKLRAADGIHVLKWTEWRSGCLRETMMAELRELKNQITIVQCCVPSAKVDPVNGRFNDLWQWTPARGWKKSNTRNWFADSFDPTKPMTDDDEPFGKRRELTIEERETIRRQVYGTHENLTDAITNHEMNDEPPNEDTGEPAEEYPKLNEDETEYILRTVDQFTKNKFVDSVPFTLEGKIG